MKTSKVDLAEVQLLTTEVRRAQSSLDAGVKGFSDNGSSATGTAFGNTSAGATCLSAHRQVQSTMDAALKAFDATASSDAERLDLALEVYQKVDAEAADQLLAAGRNRLDVISTQLTVGNSPSHTQAQDAQIRRLQGLAGDQSHGSTVVAGDFNSVATGNSPSARDIRSFSGQGFDVNAGDINDGHGGTSASHLRIDHLMPRGVGSGEAQRWDRGPSDHDGQVVDLTLPSW